MGKSGAAALSGAAASERASINRRKNVYLPRKKVRLIKKTEENLDKFVNLASDCPTLSGREKSTEHVRLSTVRPTGTSGTEKVKDIEQKTEKNEA